MTDDAKLLRRYAEEGSEPAFAEFVSRSLPLVYSAALRRMNGDTHRAREVAQQVFISAARSARQLSQHDQLTAWLYAATRNAALNLMRNERRRTTWERAAGEAETSSVEADWSEIAPLLDTAMDELSARDREALLLRFFAGLSFAELGTRCGLGENAARMRVQRALEKLRDRLAHRGVTSSAAALAVACAQHAAAAPVPAGLASTMAGEAMAGAGQAAGLAGWWSGCADTLGFMSTTKLTLAAATALAVVAVGVGTASYYTVEAERTEAAWRTQDLAAKTARERSQILEAEARAAEAALQTLRSEVTKAQAAAAEKSKVAGLLGKSSVPPDWDPVKEGTAFLTRHPEVKDALAADAAARTAHKWGRFFREQQLSPEQIARFQAYMHMGGFSRMLEGGRVMEFRHSDDRADRRERAEMIAIIGAERMADYDRYSEDLQARDQVVEVASSLVMSPTPLSVTQAKRLTETLRDAQILTPEGYLRFDWAAARVKAQGFLAPAQLEAFERLQIHEHANEVWNRKSQRSDKKG